MQNKELNEDWPWTQYRSNLATKPTSVIKKKINKSTSLYQSISFLRSIWQYNAWVLKCQVAKINIRPNRFPIKFDYEFRGMKCTLVWTDMKSDTPLQGSYGQRPIAGTRIVSGSKGKTSTHKWYKGMIQVVPRLIFGGAVWLLLTVTYFRSLALLKEALSIEVK